MVYQGVLSRYTILCRCVVLVGLYFFFFKQKTAYEMRISDWSSDVCSSDLPPPRPCQQPQRRAREARQHGGRQQVRQGGKRPHAQRAPSGHSTTRTVCSRISRSRKGE